MFTKEMIEYAAYYTYLRTLSLNSTVDIIRAWFQKDILSNDILYEHIIELIDTLPYFLEITKTFHPNRSGYYAWDGT